MSEVRDKYILALYRLAKKGGPDWLEFREAFSAVVASELEASLRTPISEALVSLGRCRYMVELKMEFYTIEDIAKKMKIE